MVCKPPRDIVAKEKQQLGQKIEGFSRIVESLRGTFTNLSPGSNYRDSESTS